MLVLGRPDQVHNCTITNISMTSLGIRCLEGFNGGLQQSFMLEVRDMSTQVIMICISGCHSQEYSVASISN